MAKILGHHSWRRLRRLGLIAGLAAPVLLLVVLFLAYIDWPASPTSVPHEIRYVAADRPGLVGKAYVYDFWGNFIDSEHLWRVEVSPDFVDELAPFLRVTEVGAAAVPAEFWRQPPYWWRPSRTAGRFFVSPGFPLKDRGPDGNFYVVVYDEAEGVIYVWYKNNF